MGTVIKAEGLGKQYRLGEIGTGTLSHDLNRWWARVRGKEDPFAKVGEVNDRTKKAESGYVWALKDVSFEVQQGEVLGIIGRNGAGKSTLLKILSKVTKPTTGSIKTKGRIASLLEVGTGFHPEMTGRENVFLNGAIMGMRKWEIQKKLDEIIDFAGVEKYIDTPVKRYSSGMYVRLAFGVAAHLNSEILIVDEVLAVGDAEFQKKCLGKMEDVSKGEGRTVLFVSHNMPSIANLCKKIMLLTQGNIQNIGPASTIIDEYISTGILKKNQVLADEIKFAETNHVATIDKIRVTVNNSLQLYLKQSDEIHVEIYYTILKEGSEVFPSFHLLDCNGATIFASFNAPSATNSQDPFFGLKLSVGSYCSVMAIPKNFLNDKSYRINAFLVCKGVGNVTAMEVLEFTVIDDGEMKKEYNSDWIGLIRPKLAWSTTKLL